MKADFITPAVTAFTEDGYVDMEANKRIYDHLIDGGMDGILLLGSIGEFFAIPAKEKKALIDMAVRHIDHRVTLYVGTNAMIFDECVELSDYALKKGADGIVVISPYYFNLPDSAVEAFYDRLAESVCGSILLYNFPARTGYDLKPEVVRNLLRRHKNIVGIKDTVDTMGHTRELIQLIKPEFPEFKIYSGFDEFFGHNLLAGGDGCISGLSNFDPKTSAQYAAAARANDLEMMVRCQQKIDGLMEIYRVAEQFIPVIKKAMILTGIEMEERCSMPLQPVTEEETERIRKILQRNKLL